MNEKELLWGNLNRETMEKRKSSNRNFFGTKSKFFSLKVYASIKPEDIGERKLENICTKGHVRFMQPCLWNQKIRDEY